VTGGVATSFEVWTAALLTLMVFSFLWRDNPLYKLAEHIFVGVSAAYWMVVGFWTTLWPNAVARLWPGAVPLIQPGAEPVAADYGVIIDPQTLQIQQEATERRRSGLAKER